VTFNPELNLCCFVTYVADGNGPGVPGVAEVQVHKEFRDAAVGNGPPGVAEVQVHNEFRDAAVGNGPGVPGFAEVQVHNEFRAQSQRRAMKVCAAGVVMFILGAALSGTGSKIIIATGRGTKVAGLIVTVTGSIKYLVS